MNWDPPASPIHRLNTDLMWQIFTLISQAGFNDERLFEQRLDRKVYQPLHVIRRASQVCREWRTIIVSTSAIWGRLIQINVLEQSQEQWIEEVMTRAGSSPLWVKGVVSHRTLGTLRPFLLSLINSNWNRIERFDIEMHTITSGGGDLWIAILRPAPLLRTFSLGNRFIHIPAFGSNATKPFFADDAPYIREFSMHGFGDVTIPPSLTTQLESLGLSLHTPESVIDFLRVSSTMTNLESLVIRLSAEWTSDLSAQFGVGSVKLARLSKLQVVAFNHAEPASELLDRLKVPDGCHLNFWAPTADLKPPTANAILKRIFSTYGAGYFRVNKPSNLRIGIACTSFVFGVQSSYSPDPEFFVEISRTAQNPVPAEDHLDISFLQTVLPPETFTSPTLVEIQTSACWFDAKASTVVNLLSTFTRANTLRLPPSTLEWFIGIPALVSIFPSLRVLEIDRRQASSDALQVKSSFADHLAEFILARQRSTYPIELVDLTYDPEQPFVRIPSLEMLDDSQFQGLRIAVGSTRSPQECVCGSGNIALLEFP